MAGRLSTPWAGDAAVDTPPPPWRLEFRDARPPARLCRLELSVACLDGGRGDKRGRQKGAEDALRWSERLRKLRGEKEAFGSVRGVFLYVHASRESTPAPVAETTRGRVFFFFCGRTPICVRFSKNHWLFVFCVFAHTRSGRLPPCRLSARENLWAPLNSLNSAVFMSWLMHTTRHVAKKKQNKKDQPEPRASGGGGGGSEEGSIKHKKRRGNSVSGSRLHHFSRGRQPPCLLACNNSTLSVFHHSGICSKLLRPSTRPTGACKKKFFHTRHVIRDAV